MLISLGNNPERVEVGIVVGWCPHCRALRCFSVTEFKPVLVHLPFLIIYSNKWQTKISCETCSESIQFDRRDPIHVVDSSEKYQYPLRILLQHSNPSLYERIERISSGIENSSPRAFVWNPLRDVPEEINEMSCQTLLQQLDAVEPKYHFHPKRLRLLQEIAMWDSLPSLFRLSLHGDVQDFCCAVQYEALLDEIDQNLPATYPNSRTLALWSLTLLPLFLAVTGISFYFISQANTHQERADWYLFLFNFWLFFPIVGYGTISYVLKRNWIRKYLEPIREKYSFKPIVLLNYLRVLPHKRTAALRSQTLRNLILEQPSENI